jgi:hypothetical protein
MTLGSTQQITEMSTRCLFWGEGLNSYPQGFIDSFINSKGSRRLNKEQKALGSVYVPYVKSVSEEFERIGKRYNIRMIFNTEHSGVHS